MAEKWIFPALHSPFRVTAVADSLLESDCFACISTYNPNAAIVCFAFYDASPYPIYILLSTENVLNSHQSRSGFSFLRFSFRIIKILSASKRKKDIEIVEKEKKRKTQQSLILFLSRFHAIGNIWERIKSAFFCPIYFSCTLILVSYAFDGVCRCRCADESCFSLHTQISDNIFRCSAQKCLSSFIWLPQLERCSYCTTSARSRKI